MNKYELWIMVVGGESDDERCIYTGNSHSELDQVILSAEDEVTQDPDKYFELITPDNNYTFYDYDDFSKLGEEKNNIKQLVNKILEGVSVRDLLKESTEYTVKLKVYPKRGWGAYIVDIPVPDHWKDLDSFIECWMDDNLSQVDRCEIVDRGIWK